MSITIVFKGPLISRFGKEKIEVNSNSSLEDILFKIDNENIIISKDKKIKAGYIILINGKDYRLSNASQLKDGDIIEILPINHGG
ncbi:MAG: MoaD/ThiS family protein [Sulfolobus sp.]